MASYMLKKMINKRKGKFLEWDEKYTGDLLLMVLILLMIAWTGYNVLVWSEDMLRWYTFDHDADLFVYAIVLFGLLVVGFKRWFHDSYIKYKTMLSFLILFPVALMPIFKCYFKIPYIFCRACPNPCVFGATRFYGFGGFFLMNLRDKFFCKHVCPAGQIQDVADKQFGKKLPVPKFVKSIRWAFFVVIFGVVVLTQFAAYQAKVVPDEAFYWYSLPVVGVFFGVILLSYFVPRVFCNYVCPVGALADLLLWLKRTGRKKYK